jgi:hypothetical protein
MSRRAAAQFLGVSPSTVGRWVTDGKIPAPPWTFEQLEMVKPKSARGARRGSVARHGSVARRRFGCSCELCLAAGHAAQKQYWDGRAEKFWFEGFRAQRLMEFVAGGVPYFEAVARVGATPRQVRAQRVRDTGFAEALDDALVKGRDPGPYHGTFSFYHDGCRCPDCRDYGQRYHDGVLRAGKEASK